MTRAEIEKRIAPVIASCRSRFALTASDEADAPATQESLRPEIRRVSLIASMVVSLCGNDPAGEALEVGSGFGYLLFSLAALFPQIRWSTIEHPAQPFATRKKYQKAFRDCQCRFELLDLLHSPLPFPDGHFSLVTFSEVLEHLPPDHVNFILREIARTIHPGGILIASSPNQASLENRLRLFRGKSIFEFPDELPYAKGLYGHIRLYTTVEMQCAMAKLGFTLGLRTLESNNSSYRGTSPRSWKRWTYRLYEGLEQQFTILRPLADTWYMAFRKNSHAVARPG